MRKLLPYEHQLIESLGITKEEYLEFVAIQQEYKDPKAGTALDIRCEPASTTAIVLTVVGVLFQVGAALLAPKPEAPEAGRRRTRQQRFAPTFGFNSTQDLATYGDPVNLVYTNKDQNPSGSTRVSGSLVWSGIENLGSTQFMLLMLVIGASKIRQINYEKTAFGQKDLNNLGLASFFIFGKADGREGAPQFNNLRVGHQKNTFYPKTLLPNNDNDPVCQVALKDKQKRGFSQAYSPTTSTSLGVFDAIPINVNVLSRNKNGRQKESNIGITLPSGSYNNGRWRNRSANFAEDNQIEIEFQNVGYKEQDKDPARTADDLRRQMVESLDFGSTYMLGSAEFKLQTFTSTKTSVDDGDVKALFKCITPGTLPAVDYSRTEPRTEDKVLKASIEDAVEILRNEQNDTSTRTVSDEGNITTAINIKSSVPPIDVNHSGTKKISWVPQLNLVDDDGKAVDIYSLPARSYRFDKAGSIAYTRELRSDLDKDLPKIDISDLKKKLRGYKKALRDLIEDIENGDFDGDDLPWLNNGFNVGHYGRQPSNQNFDGKGPINGLSGKDAKRFIKDAGYTLRFDSYNKAIQGGRQSKFEDAVRDQSTSVHIYFTFMYVDRNRNWHFFNFNGIYPDNVNPKDNGKNKLFISDGKLFNRKRILREERKKIKVLSKKERLEDPADLVEARDNVERRIVRNFGVMHKAAIKVIQDDINYLNAVIEQLPNKDQPDNTGVLTVSNAMKEVINQKKIDRDALEGFLANWQLYSESLDNNFFAKCLVKAEKATYETLSECDVVKFSLKGRLFRRISGRQKKYGEHEVEDYSNSDNGVKSRLTFFRMFFKKKGDAGDPEVLKTVFAIRRGSDADFYTQVNFKAASRDKYVFEFRPVYDIAAENNKRPFTEYAFLTSTDNVKSYTQDGHTIFWEGKTVEADSLRSNYPNETERGPLLTNEWDMFSVNSDAQIQFSFESGPEIALTAVTEQQLDADFDTKYNKLTMMALGIFAGRGVQDLRSISALVEKGKTCRTVEHPSSIASNSQSTSYAPDIFVDTLLDKDNGIGNYISESNIDIDSLTAAKAFCVNNNLPTLGGSASQLFMDGVIADVGSWREFWVNAASFSLLELARKNGKDTLVPSLPVNGDGAAAESNGLPVEVQISALFTTGNILEGSYKEEFLNYGTATEDLIASVIYRQYSSDEMFSQNRSVDVQLNDASTAAVRESFDLSQFVTQKEQAIMFGKLLCNQRRHIRKGIEFQTFPSEAIIEPGAFIYVDVGLKDWDSYSSGVVMEDGVLNAPLMNKQDAGTQNFSFLLYNKTNGDIQSLSTVSVTTAGDISTAASLAPDYVGYMFVMGQAKPQKRVYRVTEIAIEEEGEVSVKAIEYPCFLDGGKIRAHIADFRSSKFDVS